LIGSSSSCTSPYSSELPAICIKGLIPRDRTASKIFSSPTIFVVRVSWGA